MNIPANGAITVDFERTDSGSYLAFTVICSAQRVVTSLISHADGIVSVRVTNLDNTAKNNATVALRISYYNP